MEEWIQKLSRLCTVIGITPKDDQLWKQVFLHRSYLNEHAKETLLSNERLEFLGDAVLELITTDYLYHAYPTTPEGELTSFRAALVKGEHLAKVARTLNLGQLLLLSKGEQQSGGAEKDYILANTFEAVLGAVYLEHGYGAAKHLVETHVLVDLEQIVQEQSHIDSKSKLQEKAQEVLGVTPHYALIGEEGPDHSKIFEMGVFFGTEMIATGKGGSKRKGEDEAALNALLAKNWISTSA